MKQLNKKTIPKLSIGCMRFKNSEETEKIVEYCAKNGFVYFDTSPSYCYKSEYENAETWIGKAIKGMRKKIIISAKSSPNKNGSFNKPLGQNVYTKKHVHEMIEQSLKRMNINYIDYYQMWCTNDLQTFDIALQKDGWLEGVMEAKNEGLIKHIGITTHANTDICKHFIDTGLFETITIPFNILNSNRIECIEYAKKKEMLVFAMNPLSGGILTGNTVKIYVEMLNNTNISSITKLALKYCFLNDAIPLLGVQTLDEIIDNSMLDIELTKAEATIYQQTLLAKTKIQGNICTGCNYCAPCPQKINISNVLLLFFYHQILHIPTAKQRLVECINWHESYNIKNCIKCRLCERRCPNSINIINCFSQIFKWL